MSSPQRSGPVDAAGGSSVPPPPRIPAAPASGWRARALPLATLATAALFWSGNYVVGEFAVAAIDPLSLTLLRWLLAIVPLVALAAWIERPNWRDVLSQWWRLAIMSALGMVGFCVLLYEALRHTTAVSASLISALSPLMIAVVAAIVLREKLGPRAIIGLVLGLAGVLLVISKGSWDTFAHLQVNIGDLFVLAAVATWTAYTVIGRRPSSVPPITSSAAQAILAVIMLLPVVAVTGLTWPIDGPTWLSLLYIGLFPSVGSYLLWNTAVRGVPAIVAGLSLNLMPVFTVLIAVALGATIKPAELLGGVVVLAGVLIATIPLRRRAARHQVATTDD